ncbi:MAG: hypothetical protein M3128_13545 [Verrucomicrobiota bacterium]|nr:hypothetical protein [Verrucomicrobiota bacterium]
MVRFALPKILGQAVSVAGFNQITRSLPVSSDVFRIFTGVTELVIAFLVVVFLLLSFERITILPGLRKHRSSISIAANGLLLATMTGGLLAEFFARDTPKYTLVYFALGLMLISLFNLSYGFTSAGRKV